MIKRKTMAAIVAAITVALASTTLPTTRATAQSNPQVYGSQLMTQQERLEHRDRLQNAKSAAERESIRAEHHQRMQERAKKQGVTLPKEAPDRGMRQGRGQGRGMGSGGGRGRR